MSSFFIYQNSRGYFYQLRADNGEILLTSASYSTLKNAHESILSLRTNSARESQYQKETGSSGNYHFFIKAENGELLVRSEGYATAAARNKTIAMIKNMVRKAQMPVVTTEMKKAEVSTLIEFVKSRRKEAGLTQDELAEKAGVGKRFIKELEQGKLTLRLDKVNQVLNLFGHEMRPVTITLKN